MSNPFVKGDRVELIDDSQGFTYILIGKAYPVLRTTPTHVIIPDVDGAPMPYACQHFKYAVSAAAYGSGGEEEPSYDEVKAAANLVSKGVFDIGDVVVYRDGTVSNTTLTVKRCTATAVWFNETYSWVFYPSDFTKDTY